MSEPKHLIIVCHGLHGTIKDVEKLANALSLSRNDAVVHPSTANSGAFRSIKTTSLGILEGGRRLSKEVLELLGESPSIEQLSMVGHSLGGLYCRAAVPAIMEKRPDIELHTYMSIASPHCGSSNHLLIPGAETFLKWGLLGLTGIDLMLSDDGGPNGIPILVWLSDPSGPYWQALSRFKRRVNFVVRENDDKVPFHSAALAASTLHLRYAFGGSPENPRIMCSGEFPIKHSPTKQKVPEITLYDKNGHFTCINEEKKCLCSAAKLPTCMQNIKPDTFPHVTGVFLREALSYEASLASFDLQFAEKEDETKPSDALTWIDSLKKSFRPNAPAIGTYERAIISNLRTLSWLTVETHFEEFPTLPFNHLRVVAARSIQNDLGIDVVDFATSFCI